MKRYRFLGDDETLQKGDEFQEHLTGKWETVPECLCDDTVTQRHTGRKCRRPVLFTGKTAFLVNYSPIIRVEIDCTGLTDEEINQKISEEARYKLWLNYKDYLKEFNENIDWGNTKVDEECPAEDKPMIFGRGSSGYVFDITETYRFADLDSRPDEERHTEVTIYADSLEEANDIASELSPFNIAGELVDCRTEFNRICPKNPGKYRMLEVGEVIEAGDQHMHGNDWIEFQEAHIGSFVVEFPNFARRPITDEPRYRVFREGDLIEEGDQLRFYEGGDWVNISGPYPKEIDKSVTEDKDFRKLIK